MSSTCIFCKIINRTIPSTVIKETPDLLVIKDIAPKAPIHYLIIPKEHIEDVKSLDHTHLELAGKLLLMAKELSEELNNGGFRLHVNSGKDVGQVVPHLHIHFLAGALKHSEL